jgi:4-hydroxybenzoate polyprenyltransferase
MIGKQTVKPNIFSIILYVGTALAVAALAYASFKSVTVAWSVGLCVAIGVVVYAFSLLPEPKKVARKEGAPASARSPAAQAAAVVAVIFGLMLVVPTVVLWLGRYSPELGALVGALALMAMFLILWLRSRYQRSHGSDES